MPRITKHVVIRFALLVIVFEFLFAPFLADDVKANDGRVTYDTQYNSIDLPDFFKEQDEKESERSESFSTLIQILYDILLRIQTARPPCGI